MTRRRRDSRALDAVLLTAGVFAAISVVLVVVLASRLLDLRAQVAEARRECRCCDAPGGRR
jgi:hypothetical protein